MDLRKMRERWEHLVIRPGNKPAVGTLFDTLTNLYCQPDRAYHDLTHIDECLGLAEALFDGSLMDGKDCGLTPDEKKSLLLALWYHDAIYDTKSKDSEVRSADLFMKHVEMLGLQDHAALVYEAILATRHTANMMPPTRLVLQYLLDIDLSILGAERERFDRYDADIRREYHWVPEEQYRNGRGTVLQSLNRERIYLTDAFHNRFETRAHENLGRAIAGLQTPV